MAWVDPPTWDADDPWLHTDANQYVTDNTEYLYGQLSNAFVLNEWNTTPVAAANTTSWVNLVTFVVDADELAGANGFRVKVGYKWTNTGAGAWAMTLRLRYGGTTLCTFLTDDLLGSHEVHGFIDAIVLETAANTQVGILQVVLGGSGTTVLNGGVHAAGDYGTGAVDSSEARNLEIDIQPEASYSSLIFTKLYHEVHKLTAA
jgi:hypothetical protein